MTLRTLLIRGAIVAAAIPALTAGPAGATAARSSLPTLDVALTGASGVAVSGSTVSGAVEIVSTVTGKAPKGSESGPAFGIVRLDPGVSLQQAYGAVQSHHGDLDALTPYGTLMVSATAPGTVQTVLTPGSYAALNLTSNGQPAVQPFTVTQSAAPAALPRAQATETAIEFGFRGSGVLRDGSLVRAQNGGYLVHMVTLVGVRNRATGRRVVSLLRAGRDRPAQRLANGTFATLLGPASPGALQQQVLHARPGYYVEACFMDTQDGREHTQLGMERLVRVVR